MGKKKDPELSKEKLNEFINDENNMPAAAPVKTLEIKRTPDKLTVEELMLFAALFQNFLIASNLMDVMKQSKFYETGNWMHLFQEVPIVILSNPEARESFNKLVEFVVEETVDNISAKELLNIYTGTFKFIEDIGIFAFFSKATTALTSLIRG